jgi:predicted secreted protein
MAVGIEIKGREVTFTLGGSALIGVTNKSHNLTNEFGDTTDDQSNGWAERAATALLKSYEFSISGTFKNLELVKAYFGTSQMFAVVETYPDGSTLSYDATLNNLSYSADSNAGYTYEASFTSSGEPTFTPGV